MTANLTDTQTNHDDHNQFPKAISFDHISFINSANVKGFLTALLNPS